MANRTPNRGPLRSLSIVSRHGPIGVAGSAPHYFDEDAPTDGTKYFGIDKPLTIGPEVGNAVDERTYGKGSK